MQNLQAGAGATADDPRRVAHRHGIVVEGSDLWHDRLLVNQQGGLRKEPTADVGEAPAVPESTISTAYATRS